MGDTETSEEDKKAKDDMKRFEVKTAYKKYENVINSGKNDIIGRNNADFSYAKQVETDLDPEKLGILKEPYLDVLVDNVFKLPIYIEKMLKHKIPNSDSIAGVTDINESDKVQYNIADKGKPVKMMSIQEIKGLYDEHERSRGMPYVGFDKDMNRAIGNAGKKDPDGVGNKKKIDILNLDGEYASSYFIELGSCPSRQPKAECERRKYYWKNKRCWKPRYAFIKNKGGSNFGDGILFSILKSIFDLNPLEILVVSLTGKSAGGSFIAPTCDELVEDEKGIKESFSLKNQLLKDDEYGFKALMLEYLPSLFLIFFLVIILLIVKL